MYFLVNNPRQRLLLLSWAFSQEKAEEGISRLQQQHHPSVSFLLLFKVEW